MWPDGNYRPRLAPQDLGHFIVMMFIITCMVAVMSVLLFADHLEDLGTIWEAVAWSWKLALLMDSEGMTSAFARDEGLDLTLTEVRITWPPLPFPAGDEICPRSLR